MDLTNFENNKIKNYINKAKKDSNLELEVRFFQNNNINEKIFNNILHYLTFNKTNGGLDLKYNIENSLNISTNFGKTRISIFDENNIKKYWLKNNLKKIDHKFQIKKKIDNMDLPNYDIRFSLAKEEDVNYNVSKNNLNYFKAQTNKIFRLKNRISVLSESGNFRFDLTAIKMGEGLDFKKSGTIKKDKIYEIELEYIGDLESTDDIYNELFTNIGLLLQIYNNSNYILSDNEKNIVLDHYYKSIDNVNNSFRGNSYNNNYRKYFIAANPITLHLSNIIESKTNISIHNNYAATLKADGERYLLYSVKSSDEYNDMIYLINNNFEIIKTGYKLEGFGGTILEGELIKEKKMLLLYDSLFFKGVDIRKSNFDLPLTQKKDKTRLDYLNIFLNNLSNIDMNDTIISMKKYVYLQQNNIFSEISKLWSSIDKLDFKVDGIIFMPLKNHYPSKGGAWKSLLKWKPPEYNSIDFLVKTLKNEDGSDKITPYIELGKQKGITTKTKRYKTLILYVGSFKDTYDKKIKKWNKKSQAVEFSPPNYNNPDYIVNYANVFIDYQNKIIAHDPIHNINHEIKDDTIVEFVYDIKNNKHSFAWTPIRPRLDKTIKYKNGENMFGNYEKTANDIWKNINNPVTTSMITTGEIDKSLLKEKSYYSSCEANSYNPNKRLPFQNFHNLYVKKNLIMSVSPAIISKQKKQIGELLDLACGKSGDLSKWKAAYLKKVICIDIDKKCIDYAISYYKSFPRPKPNAYYVWGDTSKLIFPNQDAGLNDMQKIRLKEYIPKKNNFDIVSCQFCLHYYFETETKLQNLVQNIKDNLKVGGYFIGTCFDGKKLFTALKGKKEISGSKNDDTIWKIKKEYKIRTFTDKKPYFNTKISVFVKSIGNYHDEYLVNFKYFENYMGKHGFKAVSIKSFEEHYNELMGSNNRLKKSSTMSDEEKSFSFLNNTFTFQRVK